MANNELILTSEMIKAMVRAESIVAFQDGEFNKLVVYPKSGNCDMFSTISLPGNVWGGGAHDRMKYGNSSCHMSYRKDVFKLLKAGDSIELEWHPDNSSEFTIKRGLVRQDLYLVINRRKGSKGEIDRIKILLNSQVQDMNGSWLMCKGYDIKRTSVYDAA